MSEKYESLKLSKQLCFPLYAASREVVKYYTPLLSSVGLTYTQYVAMMVMWERERVNIKDLGEQLHLDTGTLTPLLKTLEKKGYVTRERNKRDERLVDVTLTASGAELKDQVIDFPEIVNSKINLTKEETDCLYSLLYKLLASEEE